MRWQGSVSMTSVPRVTTSLAGFTYCARALALMQQSATIRDKKTNIRLGDCPNISWFLLKKNKELRQGGTIHCCRQAPDGLLSTLSFRTRAEITSAHSVEGGTSL